MELGGAAAAGGLAVCLTNDAHYGIDLHRVAFGKFDLGEDSAGRGGNLCIYLVGGDLEQRLVPLHRIAWLLQPLGDGALKNRLAHLGHDYIGRHGTPFRTANSLFELPILEQSCGRCLPVRQQVVEAFDPHHLTAKDPAKMPGDRVGHLREGGRSI